MPTFENKNELPKHIHEMDVGFEQDLRKYLEGLSKADFLNFICRFSYMASNCSKKYELKSMEFILELVAMDAAENYNQDEMTGS